MDNPQHTSNETRVEGSSDLSMLGAQLAGLTTQLTAFFVALDPTAISGPELMGQMFPLLDCLRDTIKQGGETGFIARRVGLFLIDCLSGALRRGRIGEDVPHEHAAILDAVYQKILSTTSGVAGGAPSVEQLDRIAKDAEKTMREFMVTSGLVRKVPKEASEPSIVLG